MLVSAALIVFAIVEDVRRISLRRPKSSHSKSPRSPSCTASRSSVLYHSEDVQLHLYAATLGSLCTMSLRFFLSYQVMMISHYRRSSRRPSCGPSESSSPLRRDYRHRSPPSSENTLFQQDLLKGSFSINHSSSGSISV